jgi:hypothetical protein
MSGVHRAGRRFRVCRCAWSGSGWTTGRVGDWGVFWLMFCIVWVLWWVGVWVHNRSERRITADWNARFGRDGRGGPPRVVP